MGNFDDSRIMNKLPQADGFGKLNYNAIKYRFSLTANTGHEIQFKFATTNPPTRKKMHYFTPSVVCKYLLKQSSNKA